jgi:tetratricopeptide (TPR) repeat protein
MNLNQRTYPLLVVFGLTTHLILHAAGLPSELAPADAAYAQRADVAQDKIAMVLYERAAEKGREAEAYWKASRAAWWLGEHEAKSADRLADYQRGMTDAQKELALNANSVEGHFWLGANQGSFGDAKGVLKSLSLVKPIRHEMAEVIRLNDHYDGGSAYQILGVIDYKVPGLMGGNKARAKEELEKSLAMAPNDPFHHYYMAEYCKLTGDKARFESEITALKTLTPPADLIPETEMMRERAERDLK